MSSQIPFLVRENNTGITGFIFKNPYSVNDKTIYGLITLHSIKRNLDINTLEFTLIGNNTVKPSKKITLKAAIIKSNNFLLDLCMFVVTNPNSLDGYDKNLNVSFSNERVLKETSVSILEVNVNNASLINAVELTNQNYIYGSFNKMLLHQTMPEPSLLHLKYNALRGISGSPVLQGNTVVGIISSSTGQSSHNCLAIRSYYFEPWLSSCIKHISQYLSASENKNVPNVYVSLLKRDSTVVLKNKVAPEILNLGIGYMKYTNGNTSGRMALGVKITNVYSYLNTKKHCLQTSLSSCHSIEYKTLINSNTKLLDELISDEINSTYYIIKLTYTDKLTGKEITIDYENDINNANIDEFAFRGKSDSPITLVLVKETYNGDIISQKKFRSKCNPVETIDIVNGQSFKRLSSQLPHMYYNSINCLYYLCRRRLFIMPHSVDSLSLMKIKNKNKGIIYRLKYLDDNEAEEDVVEGGDEDVIPATNFSIGDISGFVNMGGGYNAGTVDLLKSELNADPFNYENAWNSSMLMSGSIF